MYQTRCSPVLVTEWIYASRDAGRKRETITKMVAELWFNRVKGLNLSQTLYSARCSCWLCTIPTVTFNSDQDPSFSFAWTDFLFFAGTASRHVPTRSLFWSYGLVFITWCPSWCHAAALRLQSPRRGSSLSGLEALTLRSAAPPIPLNGLHLQTPSC